MKKINFPLFIILATVTVSQAEISKPIQLVPVKKSIHHLKQTLTTIRAKAKIPVVYPRFIPKNNQHSIYYANGYVNQDGTYYQINIDYTPQCHGAKYCNAGSISGSLNQESNAFFSISDKNLTETVKLKNKMNAIYTKSHNAADFWPPKLEWRNHNVLYEIIWRVPLKNEKSTMLRLANNTR